MANYLDFAGLLKYNTLIKNHIAALDVALKESLDYTIPSENHLDGRAVVAVAETDGIINVAEGNIKASYVTVENIGTAANVLGALSDLNTAISNASSAAAITVWKGNTQVANGAIIADGNTYTIKQGENAVASINVAKDMVVSSGSVITATGTETDSATTLDSGKKYVRLVIANSSDGNNIYIPVNDLVDVYTPAANAAKVLLAISNTNEISASIKTGSIEKTDLTTALQNEISSAATRVNAKSTGHVTVAVTAASGANPAEVTISENDIASASDLASEITRATNAEGANATAISNEVTRAQGVEDGLQDAIDDEETRAIGEEQRIEAKVDAITSIPLTVENSVQSLFS